MKITNSKEFMKKMEQYGYSTQKSIAQELIQPGMDYEGKETNAVQARINYIIQKKRKAPANILKFFERITSNDVAIANYLRAPTIKKNSQKLKEREEISADAALETTLDLLINKFSTNYESVTDVSTKKRYLEQVTEYLIRNLDDTRLLNNAFNTIINQFKPYYNNIETLEGRLTEISYFGAYVNKIISKFS
jgi:hypothetical protein